VAFGMCKVTDLPIMGTEAADGERGGGGDLAALSSLYCRWPGRRSNFRVLSLKIKGGDVPRGERRAEITWRNVQHGSSFAWIGLG
jgi:hypothetical protein